MNSSPTKWLWELLGWVSLGLGFLGIPLPLLPTTPFILLALYAFSKSRPSMKEWIINNHIIGPPVRQWREKRGVSPLGRYSAMGTVVFSFSISMWILRDNTFTIFILGMIASVLLFFILRLPLIKEN